MTSDRNTCHNPQRDNGRRTQTPKRPLPSLPPYAQAVTKATLRGGFFMRPHRSCTQCGTIIATGTRCQKHLNTVSYDTTHRARRKALLPNAYGMPCAYCAQTMTPTQPLELDHRHNAIVHRECNRRDGAAITNRGVGS